MFFFFMLRVVYFAKGCTQSGPAFHESFCSGLVWFIKETCPQTAPELLLKPSMLVYVERHFEIYEVTSASFSVLQQAAPLFFPQRQTYVYLWGQILAWRRMGARGASFFPPRLCAQHARGQVFASSSHLYSDPPWLKDLSM